MDEDKLLNRSMVLLSLLGFAFGLYAKSVGAAIIFALLGAVCGAGVAILIVAIHEKGLVRGALAAGCIFSLVLGPYLLFYFEMEKTISVVGGVILLLICASLLYIVKAHTWGLAEDRASKLGRETRNEDRIVILLKGGLFVIVAAVIYFSILYVGKLIDYKSDEIALVSAVAGSAIIGMSLLEWLKKPANEINDEDEDQAA